MPSVLIFSGVVTAIALIGLLAKQARSRGITMSEAGVAVMPSVAVCATATLRNGFNWVSMCLSVGAIILGVILAGIVGPTSTFPLKHYPIRAGVSLVCFATLLLGLGGLAISWVATIISAFSPLNISMVALAISITSAICVFGMGATRGLARTAMIIIVATAVVTLLAGLLIGSVSSLGDPVIVVGTPGVGSNVFFTLAVILVTGLNPGLRDIDRGNRPQLLAGAGLVAICTALTLFGMLALVGGAIQLPSTSLATFVAYTPPLVAGIVAGLLAIVGVVVGAQLMAVLFDMCSEARSLIWPQVSNVVVRLTACAGAGVILAILAMWQPSPSWAVPTLAVIAIIGFVEQRITRAKLAKLPAEPAEETRERSLAE